MKQRFLNPLLLTILLHVAVVASSSLLESAPQKKERKPIKIVTKLSPPLAPTISQTNHNPLPTHTPPKNPTILQKPKPPPVISKKTSPKKIAPKKNLTKKPAPKKKIEPKQIRKNLNENLAKLSPPKTPQKPVKKVEKIESTTPSLSSTTESNTAYFNKVAKVFQECLTLPEKGLIKLTISVQANGKIVNIKPISYESEKNLHYLQTVLPSLELPSPEGAQEIEFNIIFCDD